MSPQSRVLPEPVADYADERWYASVRAPAGRARTLNPQAYRTPAFFEAERSQVFARSWVAVCHLEEVERPGTVVPVTVAGQGLMIVRDRDKTLRAFHNVCRHRGARLVKEPCALKRFRCPYHSWTYGLDGALLGTPLFEGSDVPADQRPMFDMGHVEDFDPADHGLTPARVDSFGHLIFVCLDAHTPSLKEWLGDLPERLAGYRLDEMRVAGRRDYDVNANWKLVAENFMEYYHLPWVHPELIKVSRLEDHRRFQGRGMYTGMCTQPITADERSGWSTLPPVAGLSADDAASGRFIWIFPNAALAVLPNHVFTMFLEPTGVDRTVERTTIALPGDSAPDGDAFAGLASFWDHVNGEDLAVIEEVQAGVANRAYTGGRLCYRFEEPLHRFQNMVADKMIGLDRVPSG
ncbi:MAG: aromatic ring-hydroxylating oxygenase subunit alpha, partial [Stackebrandtia sp.]